MATTVQPILQKNNLCIFYGPPAEIGGLNTIDAAAFIYAQFNYVVLAAPTGGDITNLQRILPLVREMNPNFKLFGYATLGNAASLAAFETAASNWTNGTILTTTLPLRVDGIFIDAFGEDFTLSTRANQNSAVDYVHALFAGCSAFANGFDPSTYLTSIAGETAPKIGTTSAVDYWLLESYYQDNADATLEVPEKRLLRAAFAESVQTATLVPAAVLGSGALSTVPYATWDFVRKELATYDIGIMGVGQSDYGATSFQYFLTNESNNAATVQPPVNPNP